MSSQTCPSPDRTTAQEQTAQRLAIPGMLAGALHAHQAGRLDEAKQLYLKILAIDVRQADCLHLLGMAEYQAGRAEIAVKMIHRAIAVDGKQADYHSNLGLVLRDLGKLDEAVTEFRQALELQLDKSPDNNRACAAVLSNLSDVLRLQDKVEEAKVCVELALNLDPFHPEAHINLGNLLQGQGNPEGALSSYERALALRPDYAEAYNNLGNILRKMGRVDEALAHYERALALKPDCIEAQWNRSMMQQL
jgi:tetratricopeptide (TPR) repeat protein